MDEMGVGEAPPTRDVREGCGTFIGERCERGSGSGGNWLEEAAVGEVNRCHRWSGQREDLNPV